MLKYQSNKCGKYCKRIIKNKSSGRFTSTCRFSFPRKPSNEFVLHDVVSSIVGRHTNSFKKRLYDLPRNSNETWINEYNPDLLLLWGGNMDIQFVSEYTYSICNYVTKYITKSEKSNIENLEFVGNDESPYQKETKFAYGLLRLRELRAHEAADRILQNSGELWRSSETYVFVPTTFPKYRTRTLKRINELENQSGSSSKLFYSDLVHDYYPNRPHDLHSLSLLSFAEQYEKIYYTPKKTPYICIKNEDRKVIGTFKKRSKIPVIYHHKYSVTKDPELFYYSLLILHKPWRNERDIIGNSTTYKEEFYKILDTLPALKESYTFKEQVRRLRDEVDADVDKIVQNVDKQDNIERKCNDTTNEPVNLGLKEFEDINSVKCMFDSEEELSSFVSTLNSDQLRIYNTITHRLRHQLDHECGKCSIKNYAANNPLLMYISGYGGTGKSYLIRAILGFMNIQRKLHNEKCDYVVAAPTGLAAAGIGGRPYILFLILQYNTVKCLNTRLLVLVV